MKLLCTSGFSLQSPLKLIRLIIKNRRKYIKYNDYKMRGEFNNLKKDIDISWRHPTIILNSLLTKKYNKYDVIANTGQRNIVTNFNIKIEDKMLEHLNPLKHKMVLQYWMLNHEYSPVVPYTEFPGGPIKIKTIKEPYKVLTAEWIQIVNSDWSVTWYKELLNDKRFFDKRFMNAISNDLPHYDVALTIKYNESEEAQEKIALSPLQCYTSFPIDKIGKEYDEVRFNTLFSLPEYINTWKEKDWSIGIPHPVSDEDTYKILKYHEKYVIKEKEYE